ncbi:uncharacterized protein SPSK_05337 [Sporothrix schenckii 1099-18]|uniref:Uncharacterized protein n=1 Tax=Sporothrix schenckii 1099-18 TaxID=1397361 RepID=A0A0F2LTH8_SPOSC|nr:uncharacterized protein SPSK_05337 [Sporothrix schenckii 1099-18]KJR80783.1 hypothetical protein SPSK_05337 [Sporothrix schenckii 1099-18]
MDTSFDDREKRFILAEMVKASHLDVSAVISFVKHFNISPDWHEMQIPHGRTINQCRQAAASMGIETPPMFTQQHHQQQLQQPGPQYSQQHRQQSEQQNSTVAQQHQQHRAPQQPQHLQNLQHQQQQQHQRRQLQQQSPFQVPAPVAKRKSSSASSENVPKRQAVSPTDINGPSRARSIQPRPPPANGASSERQTPGAIAPPTQTLRKKRGRPSRADKIAQAQAAGLTNNPFPFLAPAGKSPSINTPPAGQPATMNNYGQPVNFPPQIRSARIHSPAVEVTAEASPIPPSGYLKPAEDRKLAPLKHETSPTGLKSDDALPDRPKTPPPEQDSQAAENLGSH